MKIISFAATSAPLLAGAKTRTVRRWTQGHAETIHGTVQAYDRSPRYGGKRIALLSVRSVFRTEPDVDGRWPPSLEWKQARGPEGLAWMEERGLLCGKVEPRVYYESILDGAGWLYVVDFELLAE